MTFRYGIERIHLTGRDFLRRSLSLESGLDLCHLFNKSLHLSGWDAFQRVGNKSLIMERMENKLYSITRWDEIWSTRICPSTRPRGMTGWVGYYARLSIGH